MTKLAHKFVEFIPDALDEGVLYVSLTYGTVSHRCCCGCGREVVTPLTPTDWKLIFDGETVSLYPSIGNWNFPCRSHYWITHNHVEWAEDWSEWRIAGAEAKDRTLKGTLKEKFCDCLDTDASAELTDEKGKARAGFWTRFWKGW